MAAMVAEKALASEATRLPATTTPDWRERPHSRFLAGLLVGNIAIDCLMANVVSDGLTLFLYGMLLGQLFLMGLWLALGGLHVAARVLAVASATTVGTLAFFIASQTAVDESRMLSLIAAIVVLTTCAALLPLRIVAGWRIDFDRAYHAPSSARKLQLRLWHLIVYTAVWALACAVVQWLDDRNTGAAAIALAALAFLVSFPIAWAVVAPRYSWRFWAASTGMAIGAIGLNVLLMNGSLLGDAWSGDILFGLQAGSVAMVALNLGILRLGFDLRQFSVMDPAMQSGAWKRPAIINAELAFLASAWPQLPDAKRNELFDQVRAALAEVGEP
jgi:hypothetical protein